VPFTHHRVPVDRAQVWRSLRRPLTLPSLAKAKSSSLGNLRPRCVLERLCISSSCKCAAFSHSCNSALAGPCFRFSPWLVRSLIRLFPGTLSTWLMHHATLLPTLGAVTTAGSVLARFGEASGVGLRSAEASHGRLRPELEMSHRARCFAAAWCGVRVGWVVTRRGCGLRGRVSR
jgi:hypothetical protein